MKLMKNQGQFGYAELFRSFTKKQTIVIVAIVYFG